MKSLRPLVRPDFTGNLTIAFIMVFFGSGCSFSVTRYTDGPLTGYLSEPIPTLARPVARTVNVEKIRFQTAAGFKGHMVSDMVAQEIYIIPSDLGREIKSTLNLDQEYSKTATYEALNILARNRANTRLHQNGTNTLELIQSLPTQNTTSDSTERYVRREERLAKEAQDRGDYLAMDMHLSGAMNAMMIDQSFARAQATANTAFAVLNAAAFVGEKLVKDEFLRLRNWIVYESGAIGDSAPEGSHLSLFFLQFFDAEAFQLDSRNRVAVFMVLTDASGNSTTALEGSDILNCESECNLFQPKSTATHLNTTAHSVDVQEQLWAPEGSKELNANGFDNVSGIYQYLLLRHGLQKLCVAECREE